MKKYILGLVLMVGLPIWAFSQNKNYPQIKAIKGFLYYNQDNTDNKTGGTLSENIIDNKAFVLWNTVIGEGAAESSSRNTLIVVEIVNTSKESYFNENIRLTVTDEMNKVIFTQIQPYSIYENGNTYNAPFMLYDTGCGNIKIKAELLDKSKKKVISALVKIIEFNCGE